MGVNFTPGTPAAMLGFTAPLYPIIEAALVQAGAVLAVETKAQSCDIVLAALPLVPDAAVPDRGSVLDRLENIARSMEARGGGAIVLVMSALAAVPMRRHRRYSEEMAAAHAGVRSLAMAYGEKVRVNAVGIGLMEGATIVAGDPAQLSHVPIARAGNLEEAVGPILFFLDPLNTYTNGQLLCVDGGWSAGYARNF